MLKHLLLISGAICFFISSVNQVQAQSKYLGINIPTVSLINIVGPTNTNVSLGLNGPGEAGLGMKNTSDSTMWLNYTFLKGSVSRPKTSIYAKISNGSLPSGMKLYLTAKTATSYGLGNKGTSTGQITLNSTNQKVVQNVRSCYTGIGVGRGSNLVYDLDISNYSLTNYTAPIVLTITYTITD
jgi:hypothetical protein